MNHYFLALAIAASTLPSHAAEPPPADDQSFNKYVLRAVDKINSTYPSKGYSKNSFYTHDLKYGDGTINSNAPPMTMCVAAVAEVIAVAINMYVDETDARLIFIYSGHGDTRTITDLRSNDQRRIGYILPTDIPATPEDPEFTSKAISFTQIMSWAKDLEVKHSLFIFDSCFSGSVLTSKRGNSPQAIPSEYIFSKPAQSPLRAFLTAGTAEQEVTNPSEFMKMLTQVLLGLRRDADANRD
nr:hypothetical protein [Tanacetum cinerariifolium]